jgi:hypothetical protein
LPASLGLYQEQINPYGASDPHHVCVWACLWWIGSYGSFPGMKYFVGVEALLVDLDKLALLLLASGCSWLKSPWFLAGCWLWWMNCEVLTVWLLEKWCSWMIHPYLLFTVPFIACQDGLLGRHHKLGLVLWCPLHVSPWWWAIGKIFGMCISFGWDLTPCLR